MSLLFLLGSSMSRLPTTIPARGRAHCRARHLRRRSTSPIELRSQVFDGRSQVLAIVEFVADAAKFASPEHKSDSAQPATKEARINRR